MAEGDATTDIKNKGKSGAMWLINQFHPFGANGKLGRTIFLAASLYYAGGIIEGIEAGKSVAGAIFSPIGDGIAATWNAAGEVAGVAQHVATNANPELLEQGASTIYEGLKGGPTGTS